MPPPPSTNGTPSGALGDSPVSVASYDAGPDAPAPARPAAPPLSALPAPRPYPLPVPPPDEPPLAALARWTREHQTPAMIGAFALGVLLGVLARR